MPQPLPAEPRYAVRCVICFDDLSAAQASDVIYEERITLWRASDFDDAIERAEAEAEEYAGGLEATYVGLAQAFRLDTESQVGDGDEVFSLMRRSQLAPADYLERFFTTGTEYQGYVD